MRGKRGKKKNGKQRGPYRCTACREYGHRVDKCPNKHKLQTILDSLPGDVALESLVPEYFQILAVINGQTGEALIGAIEGVEKMIARGLPNNQSLVNAYAELAKRAAKISPKTVIAARRAYEKFQNAEREYNDAIAPIKLVLGHKDKKQDRRAS